jgi:small-conductance mechanosensitive channel
VGRGRSGVFRKFGKEDSAAAPTLLEVGREIITFIAIFLGILIFLSWMGLSFAFLLTGAGLVGALLTFAFQGYF